MREKEERGKEERAKRKREKDNEIMREEREEPNRLKNNILFIPLCYNVVLPLGQYCSTMAKKNCIFTCFHVQLLSYLRLTC